MHQTLSDQERLSYCFHVFSCFKKSPKGRILTFGTKPPLFDLKLNPSKPGITSLEFSSFVFLRSWISIHIFKLNFKKYNF